MLEFAAGVPQNASLPRGLAIDEWTENCAFARDHGFGYVLGSGHHWIWLLAEDNGAPRQVHPATCHHPMLRASALPGASGPSQLKNDLG